LSEEEKEKQQLASTLFVGLGSSSNVSLMGKGDIITQKFKRKSKISEAKNSEASNIQNIASSSFSPLPEALSNNKENVHDNGHKGLRRDSLSTSDYLEASVSFDRSYSPEVGEDEKITDPRLSPVSLFADSNIEVFQPSQPVQSAFANKPPLTPHLPEDLAEHPHSEMVQLCSSDSLTVYSCKVWKDDCLLLFLPVANTITSALYTVNLEFEHTEDFKISESLSCHFPVIEAQSIESVQKCVQMKALCLQGILSGSISYNSEMDPHLKFSVTLSVSDFIRPMKMTTEEFGKLWLSFSNDVKQNLKMSASQVSLSIALNTLHQKLKLHIVDIIGNEGIVSCRLLPSIPCLLHCRVHAGMLALWLRSPCSALPDCLLYQ
uniref:AP-4 complex subunit epsilon-1 C-terminal domain-containing protein n=1 Tax=Sphenodon punctatus TaxID=8508 RepID=A0A8D0HC64_SPHPU